MITDLRVDLRLKLYWTLTSGNVSIPHTAALGPGEERKYFYRLERFGDVRFRPSCRKLLLTIRRSEDYYDRKHADLLPDSRCHSGWCHEAASFDHVYYCYQYKVNIELNVEIVDHRWCINMRLVWKLGINQLRTAASSSVPGDPSSAGDKRLELCVVPPVECVMGTQKPIPCHGHCPVELKTKVHEYLTTTEKTPTRTFSW